MPEAGATVEEAGEGETPPWWPDPHCWLPCSVYVLTAVVVILLALALVLPTPVTAAASVCFLFFSGCWSATICPRDGIGSACSSMSVRFTVVAELSEVRVQTTARVNDSVSTLFE